MSLQKEVPLKELHIKYINETLIPEILSKLENEQLENVQVDYSGGLDGFMSALYNIELKTSKKDNANSIKERLLIAKFMKGDGSFRHSSKSYVQFANEIFIYAKVLPAYDDLLKKAKVGDVSIDNWVAHCYVAEFGYIEGLSATKSSKESVLVLDNLKPLGYKLGPRLYLNRDHLLAMARPLGQYHAMSYAMRAHNPVQFENLRKQIIPLPFVYFHDSEAEKENLFRVIYRVAFDRFYEYFDRVVAQHTFDKQKAEDIKLIENVQRLRQKYFEKPTKIMEHLRTAIDNSEEDEHFGVILHGDFNRNNVLFRYESEAGKGDDTDKVADVKLIDFQELRYASPALDLSFFMYFNTPEAIRDEVWFEILETYHKQMLETLRKTLQGLKGMDAESEILKILAKYSFDKFKAHFSRFAFYGAMICLHFLPWCFSNEEECAQLSHYFETDMHGEEFYKISMTAAGDEANKRILEIVKHASKMGYMDSL